MSLSVGEKLKVVEALDGLGVQFIEAGFPSSNPKEAEFFERLAEVELAELDDRRLRDDPAPRPRGRRRRGAGGPGRLLRAGGLPGRQGLGLPGREGDPGLPGGEPGDDRRLVRLLRRRGQAGGLRRRALLRRLPRRPRPTRSNACAPPPRPGSRTSPSATPTAAACPPSSARRRPRWSRRSATASRSASTPTTTPSARSPTASPRSKPAPGSSRARVNGYGERCGNANLASILPALQLKMGFEVVSAGAARRPDPDRPLPRRALQHGGRPRPALRRPQRLRPQGGDARRRGRHRRQHLRAPRPGPGRQRPRDPRLGALRQGDDPLARPSRPASSSTTRRPRGRSSGSRSASTAATTTRRRRPPSSCCCARRRAATSRSSSSRASG